ncbi:LPXTG cell wall anchor domain-containing protein [Enterococcus hulanensis]|uniref:LPXTG cell wall anchor domain-containing protein n=1 Tax=Enterococcus hulanensis TaxID=2559929 RepID=UPI0028920B48|nr:LPXTG cell wall anchor domain-containing protein [Enterococcus hulanensis]MDT2661352.1 LPXTG cell wall anchor domain-containing protein [Enterococcus hulanensis]
MKRNGLRLIALAVLFSGIAWVLVGGIEQSYASTISSKSESINEKDQGEKRKELEIPVTVSPTTITAIEGNTGKLSVEKFEGIEIKGTFKEIKNNSYIELKKDGTWMAKKAGITKLAPIFEPSAETIKEIEKKYPETDISWRAIAQTINVTVNKRKELEIPINLTTTAITAIEGGTGKLGLGKYEGIEIKGMFKEIKNNPIIELKKDGTWMAKKAGTTELTPSFDISKETINAIEKKYPETDIAWLDIVQSVKVTINERKAISVIPQFSPYSIAAIEGESGKLTVEKYEGIELKGTFKEIKDNPNIELSKDGVWKAKAAGETKITPIFDVSEETIKEIKMKYPDTDIEWPDIAQEISVAINERKAISLVPQFSLYSITATEGESGKLTVEKYEGIELKGTFKEIQDNPNIELSKDGTWKAKKAGETKITPIFEISEESIKEITAKYPNTDIEWPDIAQEISVTINDRKVISATTKAQKIPQTKQSSYSANRKTLPKTGDKSHFVISMTGLFIVTMAGVVFFKRKSKSI